LCHGNLFMASIGCDLSHMSVYKTSKGGDGHTAITGTGLVSFPCFCHSLIRRMQVKPSITEEVVSISNDHWKPELTYPASRDP
jgi:hypothetical protein